MIDLRQLQALSAVAAEGSVARAARRLEWSQPTVDYHLRNLDRLAGTPLTDRGPRGSRLTAAGTLMLERAGEILGLTDRALTDVRELAQLGHTRLRFGTFPTAAARLLPGITARLGEVGIELDATLQEVIPLVARVNEHSLDAALVYAASGYTLPFRSEVHTTHLFTDPLLLALPSHHRLASQSSVNPADLLSLHRDRWVLGATSGDTLDDVVREEFHLVGHELDVAIRTDDYSVVLGLVAAGLAVSLVPSLASTGQTEGVALLRIEDPRFARELILAAPADARSGVSAAADTSANHQSRAGAAHPSPSPAVRHLVEAIRRSISALG